ncbi:MAG: hypothetical protein P9M13_02490 [Candidatus Ancaeobacter aquaticus]|nr:hypothetical protein [Candidatus Ancaeobacter aquaticus]
MRKRFILAIIFVVLALIITILLNTKNNESVKNKNNVIERNFK